MHMHNTHHIQYTPTQTHKMALSTVEKTHCLVSLLSVSRNEIILIQSVSIVMVGSVSSPLDETKTPEVSCATDVRTLKNPWQLENIVLAKFC